jgi:hypothetical protein
VSVVIILIVLVLAIPIGVLVSMAVIAGGLGWFVKGDVDADHEGTEHLAISRAHADRPGA